MEQVKVLILNLLLMKLRNVMTRKSYPLEKLVVLKLQKNKRIYFSKIKGENFPVEAEILLFNAARIFHVENLIKPSINEGKVVVCDRFSDSAFCLSMCTRC